MIHPAALIESGDWSSVDPNVAFKAGIRHMRQAAVVNAALEYFLACERAAQSLDKSELSPKRATQICNRRIDRKKDLFKACDELLKLAPADTQRPHPSKRRRA